MASQRVVPKGGGRLQALAVASRIWHSLGVVLGLALAACESGAASDAAAPNAATSARADVAGELEQALASGDQDSLWRIAGRLEAQWRQAGVREDGLLALRALAAVGGERQCDARLIAASLGLELRGELSDARTRLRTARELPRCRERAQAVLDLLPERAVTVRQVSREAAVQPEVTPGGTPDVLRVERYGSRDTARVVAFLSEPARYSVGALPPQGQRGPRLFVDIEGAHYSGAEALDVGGLVERVRIGQHPTGVRLALDLREVAQERIFYLPEPFRLVIDLSSTRSRTLAADGAIRRVVLDPGHGGHDPGALGPKGLQEKDVALDVAHRAAPLIARELGISALLTRDTDVFVPLDKRVAKANAFGADLFVSIHCNASESAEGHGVMSFVLDASKDVVAKRVAARENAASEEAAQQLASVMSQFLDPATLSYSERFAQLIQRASLASLRPMHPKLVDGGVRRAGFYVLAGARMPAVLFEASFISNPREEELLDTEDYRQRLADSLVNAIRAYKSLWPTPEKAVQLQP